MFLTTANLPYYLSSRQLLPSTALISGDYCCFESHRRNRNFRVLYPNSDLFIKQIPGFCREAVDCLEREALCYQWVQSHSHFSLLRQHMVRFHRYDSDRRILALELLRHAENLHEFHARVDGYPAQIAQLLGSVLGKIHAEALRFDFNEPLPAVFTRLPPWVLTIGDDPHLRLEDLPVGHRQVVLEVRRSSDLCQGLARTRGNWRLECLIHGDIRGDNVLLQSEREAVRLYLVDWELSDIGDPLWDAAGILSVYLEYWLLASSADANSPPRGTKSDLLQPSHDSRLALNVFWDAYCDARGFSSNAREAAERKCAGLTAARLVRAAFDLAAGLEGLSEAVRTLLQAASDVFAHVATVSQLHELKGLGESAAHL